MFRCWNYFLKQSQNLTMPRNTLRVYEDFSQTENVRKTNGRPFNEINKQHWKVNKGNWRPAGSSKTQGLSNKHAKKLSYENSVQSPSAEKRHLALKGSFKRKLTEYQAKRRGEMKNYIYKIAQCRKNKGRDFGKLKGDLSQLL